MFKRETEYALMIKLVDGTSSAHLFNPYAYFGHPWSYFDIQYLRLVILIFIFALDSLSDVSLIFFYIYQYELIGRCYSNIL
jgi:hypothetical protein